MTMIVLCPCRAYLSADVCMLAMLHILALLLAGIEGVEAAATSNTSSLDVEDNDMCDTDTDIDTDIDTAGSGEACVPSALDQRNWHDYHSDDDNYINGEDNGAVLERLHHKAVTEPGNNKLIV